MGNYVTNFLTHHRTTHEAKPSTSSEACVQTTVTETEILCTPPISQTKCTLSIDPRSATAGIQRTPIQVNCTPITTHKRINAIPRHLQSKQYLETDLDNVLPALSPKKPDVPKLRELANSPTLTMNQSKNDYLTPTTTEKRLRNRATERDRYKILGIDPRSPVADFSRTPILMPQSLERLRARSYDNLQRRGSYESDMCTSGTTKSVEQLSCISFCETVSAFGVPEIQALPDIASIAIKNLKLVDDAYLDTMNESGSSSSSDSSTDSSSAETIIPATEDNAVDDKLNSSLNNDLNHLDNNPCSPKVKLWANSDKENQTGKSIEILIFSDDDNTQSVEVEGNQEITNIVDKINVWTDPPSSEESKESEVNKSNDENISNGKGRGKNKQVRSRTRVQEKKVFSMDKNTNDCATIRTPLGNRSNKVQMQEILVTGMSPQQCFQRSSVKTKLNSTQWDPNSTFLI